MYFSFWYIFLSEINVHGDSFPSELIFVKSLIFCRFVYHGPKENLSGLSESAVVINNELWHAKIEYHENDKRIIDDEDDEREDLYNDYLDALKLEQSQRASAQS